MIQHTMQEIADFFGCYAAKDSQYAQTCDYLWLFENKPYYTSGVWYFTDDYYKIGKDLISDFDTHDPSVLVEPRKNVDILFCETTAACYTHGIKFGSKED